MSEMALVEPVELRALREDDVAQLPPVGFDTIWKESVEPEVIL